MLITLTLVQTALTGLNSAMFYTSRKNKNLKLKCIYKTKSGFKHYKYV